MKTTWLCYGLVANSFLLFFGLLRDSSELLYPTIFFSLEIVLFALLFRKLYMERELESLN